MSWVVECLMKNFLCVLSSDYSVYYILLYVSHISRSSHPDVFLVKGVPKICSEFIEELLSKCDFNLQSNFIKITLLHGCPSVKLLHIFKSHFSKNTFGWLLLYVNPLSACVVLIQKPANGLSEQVSWLVSIWGQHWHLMG